MKKELYMAAIEPPAGVVGEIRILQKTFAEKYGSAAALKPPVHITFSPPEHLDDNELELYKKLLSDAAGKYPPFKIELRDFDFFVRNKVLFVAVETNDILTALHNDFESLRNQHNKQSYHPHVTIGYRKLLPETFNRIMADYSGKKFEGEFIASGINLWKHEGGYWKTIQTFSFR